MFRIIYLFFIFLVIVLIKPPNVDAIVFLPALLLIPIAQILGILLVGLSFPLYAIGYVWHLFFKMSLRKVFAIVSSILAIIILIVLIVIKILFPELPLF